MKNNNLIKYLGAFLFGLVMTLNFGCERDLTDDAVVATFPTTGDIFTDSPIGLGSNFYFPYGPDASNPIGAKPDAWDQVNDESYLGTSSMRIDVPNGNDPEGNYAGGILRIDGAGRNLTGYDALTFWAKASQNVTIGQLGFGEDFGENKYQATIVNTDITTAWKKYIIPIPDASKLLQERGMFRFSAGGTGPDNLGYTFWIDELKFEKLGTIGQARPAIENGEDVVADTFTGVATQITGLRETFNLASGLDQSVVPSVHYFEFTSSNPSVASVDEFGLVTVNGAGTAVVTATLGGLDAAGSLTINSLGDFQLPATPTQNPSDVISIFSDTYDNVNVDFYNGFWEPFQTTLSADFVINGDNILNYTNFNFVGNQFANPTVDASEMEFLHIDMYIPGELPSFFNFLISVVDFGPDGVDGGGDDTRQQIFLTASDVEANTWMGFDFPITLANRDKLGLLIYENINNATLSNFYLDNIYFYKEPADVVGPTDAPEPPTEDEIADNVISVFSDAYTDVGNDGLNNFDSGSILSVETIASNEVLNYSNLDFTGLEFLGPNIIDASATTTLHLDIWSPDTNELKIKLVDFGADGAFGGGDDTEHEINFGPTTANEWIAYDIPLTDFIGLGSTANIAQIVLVNSPQGTLFVDNIYFYN